MRLSPQQVLQIHECLKFYFKDLKYDLFLYGSRTQDHLKGGDIDLLILTDESGVLLFEKSYLDLMVNLKKKSTIGQRRVDIKAALHEELTTNPFLKSITPDLIKI